LQESLIVADDQKLTYEELMTALQDLTRKKAIADLELLAWRDRFPAYVYRPQDDVVSLRIEKK
jgi:hypothetical protein